MRSSCWVPLCFMLACDAQDPDPLDSADTADTVDTTDTADTTDTTSLVATSLEAVTRYAAG